MSPSFELTGGLWIGGTNPLVVMAGPCVIESRDLCLQVAEDMRDICRRTGLAYVFKASFDKANRTSVSSFRGPGLDEGLAILAEVREECGVPVLTDIHEPDQAAPAAGVVDALQIPAFLCRQTDLLLAAGRTGKPVAIKKGQFLAPEDMGAVRELGTPVIFDCTHSVQLPGGQGTSSGGQREYAYPLARAAAAVGIDALFLEVHPDPPSALSDSTNCLALSGIEQMLTTVKAFHELGRKS